MLHEVFARERVVVPYPRTAARSFGLFEESSSLSWSLVAGRLVCSVDLLCSRLATMERNKRSANRQAKKRERRRHASDASSQSDETVPPPSRQEGILYLIFSLLLRYYKDCLYSYADVYQDCQCEALCG